VCVGVLAVFGAVVAARGPATKERSEYTWPPQTLPDERATQGWYAPSPLLNRVPAVLEVTLPCRLSPPIRPGPRATVVSTDRRPVSEHGLVIERIRGALTIACTGSSVSTPIV
jgi:hypothetical protein